MANRSSQNYNQTTHLNAQGSREVVYCHQCEQEWYHEDYGLECPYCEGTVTEIVVPGQDDPRGIHDLETSSFIRHDLESWFENALSRTETGNSSPTSSTMQNTNSRTADEPRNGRDEATSNETGHVLSDFRNMISNLLGPQLRHSMPGRSGLDTLFHEPSFQSTSFRFGGNGNSNSIAGSQIIFTNTFTHEPGSLRPRHTHDPREGGTPEFDDIAAVISNIIAPSAGSNNTSDFDGMSPHSGPLGIHTLFSAFFGPRNARFGDAVYSDESLDQIISRLLEQSPVSNAPGPASPEAIALLPRKKLDAKLLAPEGRGECSICMDEVKIGDEVVVLPCNHWFDESCVTSWLREHNTCPICRKGIKNDGLTSFTHIEGGQADPSNGRNEGPSHRTGTTHSRFSRETRTRNQERLDFLRNAANMNLSEETTQLPIFQERDDHASTMPGSFPRDSTDHSEGRDSNRPRSSRTTSTPGNSGNVGRSGTFSRLREFHDRLSNSRRHD